MSNSILKFSLDTFGNIEKHNETMSKGRCGIFYKGLNRNGTYITDEFANKLLSSIAYTPVKGIYEIDDFSDHGEERTEGRIYGIVPLEHNFAWETHMDKDGVERTYACVDVLYYTALYPEAKQINGKSQSMELYGKSIKGNWQFMNGQKSFVFTDGCFLGLQVLGDEVEPCFEGAQFYSLGNDLEKFIKALDELNQQGDKLTYQNFQGGNKMCITFKISDNQKFDIIWNLLNTNFNEENNYQVDYSICDIYDSYAIVRNHTNGTFERVYYSKNDETDSLEIINKEICYIIDVNEAEKNALQNLKNMNNNTFEVIDEQYKNLTEEKVQFEVKIVELNGDISTLNTKIEETNNNFTQINEQYEALNKTYSTLQNDYNNVVAERDELVSYKKDIVDNNKKDIINSYSEFLSSDLLAEYEANMDKYTVEELDMKLTYEQKKANPSMFTKKDDGASYIPSKAPTDKWKSILSPYENK